MNSGYADGWSRGYEFNPDEAVVLEGEYVYVGQLMNCYGHVFTDNLKKLWWLQHRASAWGDIKVVYTTEKNEPLAPWTKEVIRLCGMDADEWLWLDRLTRCERLVVPDNAIRNTPTLRSYHPYLKQLIERIKVNALREGSAEETFFDKLYFTRTGIKNYWRECGEQSVERFFARRGYHIVSPQELTVGRQIRMLLHCRSFAATEGSVGHNSIFCRPNTQVYILRKADYCNLYQVMIDEMMELDVTYIDVHRSVNVNKKLPMWGPFYLYPSRALHRCFNKFFYRPYWSRLLYWAYAKNRLYWYQKYIG